MGVEKVCLILESGMAKVAINALNITTKDSVVNFGTASKSNGNLEQWGGG